MHACLHPFMYFRTLYVCMLSVHICMYVCVHDVFRDILGYKGIIIFTQYYVIIHACNISAYYNYLYIIIFHGTYDYKYIIYNIT